MLIGRADLEPHAWTNTLTSPASVPMERLERHVKVSVAVLPEQQDIRNAVRLLLMNF